MSGLAVFAYGSLVSPASAELTLGRPVPDPVPAELDGWRRRWTTFRDNQASEKTFALTDGSLPPFVLGLNLERVEATAPVNGALLAITPAEADRLDLRELRYRRVDVTGEVRTANGAGFEEVIAYLARPAHHAPAPPDGAVVMASYLAAVEAAFAELGPGELERFRASTDPPPVEPVEATLVRDQIPTGNPRAW